MGEYKNKFSSSLARVLVLVLIVILQAGCNYSIQKGSPQGGTEKPTGALDFQNVKSKIFEPKCIKCHAGLQSYTAVKGQLSTLLNRIESKQMPPGGGLRDQEIAFVLAWANAGAPEFSDAPPEPTPTPPPILNFARVNREIFSAKCVACHDTEMASYKYVSENLADIKEMIVTRQMPPSGMSEDLIELFLQWVKEGARE